MSIAWIFALFWQYGYGLCFAVVVFLLFLLFVFVLA
jgi:hypothetical protein